MTAPSYVVSRYCVSELNKIPRLEKWAPLNRASVDASRKFGKYI